MAFWLFHILGTNSWDTTLELEIHTALFLYLNLKDVTISPDLPYDTPAAANAALTMVCASSWILRRCSAPLKLSAYSL